MIRTVRRPGTAPPIWRLATAVDAVAERDPRQRKRGRLSGAAVRAPIAARLGTADLPTVSNV